MRHYICPVENYLDNPVYYALVSGNASLAKGTAQVKYFDEEVSPFAGFADDVTNGFQELHQGMLPGRLVLYASRTEINLPPGYKLINHVPGTQFIYPSNQQFKEPVISVIPLDHQHVEQMMQLAALTKPGPFGKRTIDFGHYHGIFDGDKLVAMTGRRLHVYDHLELSAVCTHPAYLGKGFAQTLIDQQVNSILAEDKIPFLHVRSDNKRAIDLYERSGFVKNGPMHFYFLSRL